jgi:hypothetical protein
MEDEVADDDKVKRYREAAEITLEQLDWCIWYLRGIRRREVARTLSRNRDQIRDRLRKLSAANGDEKSS